MDRLERAVKQVRWSIAQRGLAGTAALLVQRALGRDPGAGAGKVERGPHPFDVEHGTDTGGRIGGSHLGGGHAHDVHVTAYLGVPPSRFAGAIAAWRGLPGVRAIEEYAFFDVGCGKGRAVMLASAMGFREVGGVELDPGMAAVGRGNMERWVAAGKASCRAAMVQGDAIAVPLPDGPLLLFVYNPFRGPVMRKLLQRLEERAAAGRGGVDLIYLVPEETVEFTAFTGFVRLWAGTVRITEEDQVADGVNVEDKCEVWRR